MKDKEIAKLIKEESDREKKTVDLIASENFVSEDILESLGSVFTNKYAEGYPEGRYYGGTKVADKLENLVRKRALRLFKLSPEKWAVNVQPYSGSPANLAVYLALVPPGEKIMGMSLNMGGHLTHGQKVSVTGKIWQQVPYGVSPKTEKLDYAEILKMAEKERPKIIVAGYTAYPRVIDFKEFREIADKVGAILMVDMSHFAGLVAGGAYPSPFEYADVVMTTTHKTLRGPRGAMIFSRKRELPLAFLSAGGSSAPAADALLRSRTAESASRIPSSAVLREPLSKAKGNSFLISDLIDKAVFPGLQGGPHLNAIAAIGVALREAGQPSFKAYARQVIKNAKVLADELGKLGWRIVSGGTDTHLLLVDTMSRGIGGKEAAEKLENAGIIVNKNTIPYDTRKPTDPSGIRIGTPAVTTRGMKEEDMEKIAKSINEILINK